MIISIALTWEDFSVEPSIFHTKRNFNQSFSFKILVVQTNDANEYRSKKVDNLSQIFRQLWKFFIESTFTSS